MSLRDQMASDFTMLTSADDFGETVTVTPYGQTALTFTVAGVFGDQTENYVETGAGVDRVTESTFMCKRSAWRTAIDALTGYDARDPLRGDRITGVAGTANAGDWSVVSVNADIGDGLSIVCRRPDDYRLGARGAFEAT